MAAYLEPIAQEIEQQFVDLFYGQYMAEQWGIEVGYKSVPTYMATMRMELLNWQQNMDCDNSLCTAARATDVRVVSLASGTADTHVDQPCCNDNARFQPL